MKEALFLKRNIDKWKRYEEALSGTGDPDTLASAFIELTDDLAYARTFYPESSTSGYLNGLASGFHHRLYKNKKESTARVWSFWQYELPLLFRQYRRYLLYAFIFFVVLLLSSLMLSDGIKTVTDQATSFIGPGRGSMLTRSAALSIAALGVGAAVGAGASPSMIGGQAALL